VSARLGAPDSGIRSGQPASGRLSESAYGVPMSPRMTSRFA
jgi:hypothetical protein